METTRSSHPHDLIPAIHVKDLTRDGGGDRAGPQLASHTMHQAEQEQRGGKVEQQVGQVVPAGLRP